MAKPPRVTDADVAQFGGTLSNFIEGMLEQVRVAPMEEKVRCFYCVMGFQPSCYACTARSTQVAVIRAVYL